MKMAQPNLDPVEVAKYVASLAMSPALAQVVGPYSIIILSSILGAAVGLTNRDPLDRGPAFYYFARAILTSLLATVPIATLVATYFDGWEAQWLFIPAAAILAYMSGRWREVAGFVGDQLKALIANWVNGNGKGPT